MISTISSKENAKIREKYIKEFIESERDDSILFGSSSCSDTVKITASDGYNWRNISDWSTDDRIVSEKYARENWVPRANPDSPAPTKFWECEYCGCVTPVDSLDCRKCGHSATKKAMLAAFGAEIKTQARDIPKMSIDGPGAEEVEIDQSFPDERAMPVGRMHTAYESGVMTRDAILRTIGL